MNETEKSSGATSVAPTAELERRKHTWYACKCNQVGCMFCDGGLGHCTVCNGFEGTLTTECCGRRITEDEERRIYKEGNLDFVSGRWVDQPNYPRSNDKIKGARLSETDSDLGLPSPS